MNQYFWPDLICERGLGRCLKQSYTYLSWTASMKGTIKREIFGARYAACHHKKLHELGGGYTFGRVAPPSHNPIHCCGLECGGTLGTTAVQNSECYFMQQPKSILWCLHIAISVHLYGFCTTLDCGASISFGQLTLGEYLCVKFGPLEDKPHIVVANMEELIAKKEHVQAEQWKKRENFLGSFGSLAFATAPLYSTFSKQDGNSFDVGLCLV